MRVTINGANRKLFILIQGLFLAIINCAIQAQNIEFEGRNILHPFSAKIDSGEYRNETVQYMLLGDLHKNKPLIVFCSGSMPSPQLLKMPDGKFIPIGLPFNFYQHLAEFNFLLLSKPGVPLAAEQKDLDPQFNYLDPHTSNFPDAFLARNNASYYQAAWTAAIDNFLSRELVIKPGKIVLMGHSQGARVATKLAKYSTVATHLVYLSADPMGRYWEIIRRETDRPEMEASDIDSIYHEWAEISAGKGRLAQQNPSELKSTQSFSESLLDDLLEIEMPIFLGYGTWDIACNTCGLVYFEALRMGKTNIHHGVYPRLDHNFFPFDAEGRPDYNAGKWDQVAMDVINWVREN
jgi:pimeloyl-ACP methyl ester carboxylesterase